MSRAIGLVAVLTALAGWAEGAMTLTASRTELLYTGTGTADCAKLKPMPDDQLPFNIARVRAQVTGAPAGKVQYHWSLPPTQQGTLAADLDLAPGDETSRLLGMCGEFGTQCSLTATGLKFYTDPSILWVAPSCIYSKDPTKPFRGGTSILRVAATVGGRVLGKKKVRLGYGRLAAVIVYANGQDGRGKPSGIPVDIDPQFTALTSDRGASLPAVESFEFDNGGGEAKEGTGPVDDLGRRWDDHQFDLLYHGAGKFIATVTEKFVDGSVVCDNAPTQVYTCTAAPKLEIKTTPRHRSVYTPGDPVRGVAHLRVILRNDSPRAGGCNFLLEGNVLSCVESVEVGGTSDTRTTSFDLPRCAQSGDPCSLLERCPPGDSCLTRSHCSATKTRPCARDAECRVPVCKDCEDGEQCIHVLGFTPPLVLPVGRSLALLDMDVTLANDFPDVAKMTDTWTVETFNAGSADASVKYLIRASRSGAH